jgi:hypothetical protein
VGHENYNRREDVQGSSNRSFGLVFAAVLLVVGVFPWLFGGILRLWALFASAAFLAVALVSPSVLAPLNRLWTRFGLLLHKIVSPIVLSIMFYLVITPIGLLMRLFGKDPLRLKYDPSAESYWIPRDPPGPAPESLKDQF